MGNKSMWVHSLISLDGKYSDRRGTNTNHQRDKDGINVIKGISRGWIEDDRHEDRGNRNKLAVELGADGDVSGWMHLGDDAMIFRDIFIYHIY